MKVKDNAQAGMPGEDRIDKRIMRFLLGTKWGILLTFSSFFCALSFPPIIYSWNVYFPAENDIHHTKGVFTYKYVGKAGYMPGLSVSGKDEVFGCKAQGGLRHYCINDKELFKNHKGGNLQRDYFERWEGKNAEILWFYQPMYFFSKQRRVIEIIVDDVVVLSRENVKKDIDNNRGDCLGDLITTSIFLMIGSFIIYKCLSRREK